MEINFSLDIFNWILNVNAEIKCRDSLQELETGYVYLVQAHEGEKCGLFKIGQTKRLSTRIKAISRQVHSPLDIVRIVAVINPIYVETTFHTIFKEKRIQKNGEWFALDKDDVTLFSNIASLTGRLVQAGISTSGEVESNAYPPSLLLSTQALLEFFDFGLENGFARDKMAGRGLPSGFYVGQKPWKECIERLKDLGILYSVSRHSGHRMLVRPDEARQMILIGEMDDQ